MTIRPRILVADSDEADRELAMTVLRQYLPECDVEGVGEPMALAERLLQPGLAGVVTEHSLSWGRGLEVTATVTRLHPGCAVVLFTRSPAEDVLTDAISRGVDGLLLKSSAGFLALPAAVRAALDRAARRRDARAGEERYRTLIEEMPVGVVTLSAAGTVVAASPAAVRLLGGGTAAELIGSHLPGLLADSGRDRLRRLLEAGTAVRGLEAQVRSSDGAPQWIRLSAWPVGEPGSAAPSWEASLEDISTYRQAERQLEERAAQLARSNADLQQFSYAISHDLQEPLQLVTRYAQLLSGDEAASLDAQAQRWLAHMLTAVARMQAMINDVLEYSRVESRGEAFVVADVAAAVDEALANLRSSIDESGAKVTVGELPRIAADPRQLVQLFQNLVGNAVKFRGDAPPVVQISAVEADDAWVLAVMDNGIGIPKESLDRVFGMFQRLHGPVEYPGTGIGLALCKRIVERHGGQIWATSQPGEGSTFYFSIPKQPVTAVEQGKATPNGGGHGRKPTARSAG